MTIYVYKAQGIGDQRIESLEIRAENAIPNLPDKGSIEAWRRASLARFEDEGVKIAAALVEHLPGGTVDQVLRALLQHRASHFIVPFTQRQPEVVTYPTTTDSDLSEPQPPEAIDYSSGTSAVTSHVKRNARDVDDIGRLLMWLVDEREKVSPDTERWKALADVTNRIHDGGAS
jgi:antitoxin component of RelBE/YafQ-DinJ toxin-antitoxin module